MKEKIKIDEEIENLKDELDAKEDTHLDYLSAGLKDLQAKVITTHAHLEIFLENRIVHQIAIEEKIGISTGERRIFVPPTVFKLMGYISFKNKLEIVNSFRDGIPFKVLEKVNTYRNEFAHPKGIDLRNKYDYNTAKGKINIRDLLRSLIQGEQKVDNYVSKIF